MLDSILSVQTLAPVKNAWTTALAVQKPRSHQELLEIYGIGTVKAERFGSAILRVIEEVVG